MTSEKLTKVYNECLRLSLEKNEQYGDSLQNPPKIFCKEKLQGIYGRIDDKLARVREVGAANALDTMKDLVGYLVHAIIIIEDERG